MNNALKFIGIIAFAAMIVFSFASCPDSGSSREVSTRFIFDSNIPPANRSAARAARSAFDSVQWDEGSFSFLNDYYDSLNGLVRSYTPEEFSFFLNNIYVMIDNKWYALYSFLKDVEFIVEKNRWSKDPADGVVNFANTFTFTPLITLQLTQQSPPFL